MKDDAAETQGPAQPVILFDGECNLCAWSVTFIIRRDPRGRFRFAALQSPAGQQLLAACGAAAPPQADSVLLVEGQRCYTGSEAALRIARGLAGGWPLLSAGLLVPRPPRDWLYAIVARNRFRWFGRRDTCMLPTPAQRERFL